MQDQGTRIALHMDVRAPTLLVPQHSESTNVVLLKLGDFSLKNAFEETEAAPNIMQNWDHMYIRLDYVQVLRYISELIIRFLHCFSRGAHFHFLLTFNTKSLYWNLSVTATFKRKVSGLKQEVFNTGGL